MTKTIDFEGDPIATYDFMKPICICAVCEHRNECPDEWRCETLAILDNDYTEDGDW